MTSRFSLPNIDAGFPGEEECPRSTEELERALGEARAAARRLTRELGKEQARHAQTADAYNKTVQNMLGIVQENLTLSNELDRLKRQQREVMYHSGLTITPLPHEAAAIRKAMARLHHPDVGGDEQRMKAWNVALDKYEQGDA